MIKYLLTFCAVLFSIVCFCQEDLEEEKKFDHYIGLQMNEFIRQIFNITSTSLEHPYYLNYAINMHKNGWGMNFGFGYDYFNTIDGDAITEVNNSLDKYSFRLGPEKKYNIGKRFITFF